jgi:hypothetical protein
MELPVATNVDIARMFHVIDFGFYAGASHLLLEDLIVFSSPVRATMTTSSSAPRPAPSKVS